MCCTFLSGDGSALDWCWAALRSGRGAPTAAAAVGIALINSIGNLGGFFGPYIVGQKASETNATKGLFVLAASFLVAAVLLAVLRAEPLKAARQEREVAGGGRRGARRPLETPVRAWTSV